MTTTTTATLAIATPGITAPIVTREMDSPLGRITLEARGGALTGLRLQPASLPDATVAPATAVPDAADDAALEAAATQLTAYFSGTITRFDVPLHLQGTPWQRDVWAALLEIPYGTTTSYGELARRLGRPTAARAVGAANGRNPVSIIVPCHRVIGADASLTGYAWGPDRKRWLLDLERGLLSV